MSEIVLYQYSGTPKVPSFSPPCLKISLALKRLGLAHRVVDLASPLQVNRYSPSRRVPAIVLDGETIADSVFILDRLEALHPDAATWPKDPAERVVDRLWDCFATDTLYWQGFYLRWLVPETRKRVLDAAFGERASIKKAVVSVLGGRELRKRAHAQGIGGRARGDVDASFQASVRMVESGLGAGPFLQSRTTPGRGDLALAGFFAQFHVGVADGGVTRFWAAHQRIPAHVAATFEACGLPPP